ncbi:MAG: hypothetical protein ACE5KT_02460 [Methanosarcinales archaeon]
MVKGGDILLAIFAIVSIVLMIATIKKSLAGDAISSMMFFGFLLIVSAYAIYTFRRTYYKEEI